MSERLPPLSAIQLRDLRPEDALAIRATFYPDRPPSAVAEFVEHQLRRVRAKRAVCAVAAVDGQMRAMAQLSILGDGGEIEDLRVAEGWRECGLGRALIGYLTGAARARGLRRLEIAAEPGNARALSLYRRLGFTEARTLKLDLDEGTVELVVLGKTLGQ